MQNLSDRSVAVVVGCAACSHLAQFVYGRVYWPDRSSI